MAKALPQPLIDLAPKLEAWGKLTVEIFGSIRANEGLAPEGTPEDQVWFWSKEWQAMEKEADEDYAQGDFVEFDNVDEAINCLHEQV